MSGLRFAAGALAVALSFAAYSPAANATYRGCGYDPYGYHPPSWRGCPNYVRRAHRRAYREGWGFYSAYGFYPAGSYYAVPRYPVYAVPEPIYPAYPPYPTAYCYYDNGYDFRVRSVCVPAW
jgi:hypothetical protein